MSMKITMMGCSGTGKTCYLYGTYITMLNGISGFNFNPSDWNQGLQLENSWYSLLEPGACWPQGNNLSEEYLFDVFYDSQKLGEFTWLDYRGGILDSRMEQDSQNEVQKFSTRCKDSSAIIVAIPADVLINASHKDYAVRGKAERMLSRYKSILLKLPNLTATPIVLMITKGDLIHTFEKKDRVAVLQSWITILKKQFDILFNHNQEAVMIVRTMLGKFTGEMQQGGLIEGEFNPQFIHLPILFPLYLDFARQAAILQNAGNCEANQSWWGKFWNGDDSASFYKNADEMKKKADALWNEFVGAVDIYQKGEPILNSSGT